MALPKIEEQFGDHGGSDPLFSPRRSVAGRRLETIDFARGIAVALMILSHSVVGLVPFQSLEGWQLVPVHLFTKFSSTLFFTVFGFALGLIYLPRANEPDFAPRRRKLVFRGLEILVWYKVLTFIQMFQIYDRERIINTLLYLEFPDFAEVLGFYALFLLWFPFVMPLWDRLRLLTQYAVVAVLVLVGWYLTENFDFWGYTNIKALLVEHQGYYTFGQFQRGALVMFGTILARHYLETPMPYVQTFPLKLFMLGCALFGLFFFISYGDVSESLRIVASNGGKHPPDLRFMSFSLGGALVILGTSMLFRNPVPWLLRPFVWIGQKSLQAFVFHIFVIFVVYRYLLDYWRKIPYEKALTLALLLIALTSVWCGLLKWKDRK